MRAFRIIAEVGLHHGGNLTRAQDICSSAVQCGADACKLQFFTPADLAERPVGEGWDVLARYAMTVAEVALVSRHVREIGGAFGCSFFGLDGVAKFSPRRKCLDFAKIPAPLTQDRALLRAVRALGVPLCLSYYPDAEIYRCPSEDDTLLHCTRGYPTRDDDLHLHRMQTMPKGARIGWSCHAEARHPTTAELACLAYAAGARVFEFHFCDDQLLPGSPDYDVSLWPELLAYTVQQLDRCARIFGGLPCDTL